jgi:GTPase SAR1 family protein
MYKIILLGTAGVGKSSVLSVAVTGDGGYQEGRPTTLEAEFGSLDFSDRDTGGKGVRRVD